MLTRRTFMTTSGSVLAGGVLATSAPARTTTAGVTSAGSPLRVNSVTLTVRDLDTVSRFYQQVMGLKLIEGGPRSARLGVGDRVLLDLRHDPAAAPASRRSAGLFHTAFLLPSRADLAQWLLHVAALRIPLQGASDHLVSEAIYLADPEGNGIEIYHDRPSETWTWQNGMVNMATLPLDLDGLVASVRTPRWSGLPEGSSIGHVHLQVGDLRKAEEFYAGLLGLDVVSRSSSAAFLSSGGYHHHLAVNTWNSHGAPIRPEATAGLATVELIADPDIRDAIRARMTPEQAAEQAVGHLSLRDPWGTSILLLSA